MNDSRCTRKGPKTRGVCSKFWGNEHPEHHSFITGERWTDADSEAARAEKTNAAAQLDVELSAFDRSQP